MAVRYNASVERIPLGSSPQELAALELNLKACESDPEEYLIELLGPPETDSESLKAILPPSEFVWESNLPFCASFKLNFRSLS